MVLHGIRARQNGYPADLRGERHKEALSGPVVTYRALEEIVPAKPCRRGGIFVRFYDRGNQCLYVSAAAAEQLMAHGHQRARVQFDNLERRLIITPCSDGPWTLSNRKGIVWLGSTSLQKYLLQKGVEHGCYEVLFEGNSLIVDLGGRK